MMLIELGLILEIEEAMEGVGDGTDGIILS